jgi:hypothetical protein
MRIIFIVLLFVCTVCSNSNSYAQTIENPVESLKREKEFIYGIDNRRTHLYGKGALIYGVFVGFGFNGNLRFKTGISGTPFAVRNYNFLNQQWQSNKLGFITVGQEFDFLIIKRFRLTAYLQAGIGYNYLKKYDSNLLQLHSSKTLIIPFETGLNTNYSINHWLRLVLGGGWRFVEPEPSNELSGYYIKIGLSINSKKLWREIKKSNIKVTKKNPY